MKINKSKNKIKSYNFLAIFYFFLIFGIVIYLFMTLFTNSASSTIDTEMDVFKNSNNYSEDAGHNIIMKYPEFAIKKRK